LAAAAPVVATEQSGLAELITPQTGSLIAASDHELLADQIERALDENWRQTKGPAAQQLIAGSYSLDATIGLHVEHYRALLGERFGRTCE
jgi:glycosyltransferase involved in cell wall biosynthesis